jgi:hypothetical protein
VVAAVAQTDAIVCRDGCKRSLPDMDAATQAGWHYLSLQSKWRCPDCARELREANDRYQDWSRVREQPQPEFIEHGAGI